MRKRTGFFFWRKPKRKSVDAKAFWAAVAVAGALLLAAFVLQQTVTPPTSLVEKLPAPSFASFMPPGAAPAGAVLEIADLPQPSYVVAYDQAGTAGLALVAWSRDLQRYAMASSVPLAEGSSRLTRVESLSLETMGSGASPLILAKGPAGATGGAFALTRDAGGLRVATLIDETGRTGGAFFMTGNGAGGLEEFALEDVDADGRKEAVATRRALDAKGSPAKSLVRAFRWSDGELRYDKDLSWALTISQDLFPEPKGAATSGTSCEPAWSCGHIASGEPGMKPGVLYLKYDDVAGPARLEIAFAAHAVCRVDGAVADCGRLLPPSGSTATFDGVKDGGVIRVSKLDLSTKKP